MKAPADAVRDARKPSSLAEPVDKISHLTPATRSQLERLGIRTIRDLIRHYPYRYDDLTSVVRVADLGTGALEGEVNVTGVITQFRHVRLRKIKAKSSALIEDGSGQLQAVWFGRPYLGTQLKPGMRVLVRGRVERTLSGPVMTVSLHRIVAPDEPYEGELLPVYPLTAGLQNRTLRRLIGSALALALGPATPAQELDPLPASVAARHRLRDSRSALRAIHAPKTEADAKSARRRLVFEEFFLLATSTALRKAALQSEPGPDFSAVAIRGAQARLRESFAALAPFSLTHAQERCIDEIAHDMLRKAPMNRLLQGDVGSGKTAVAAAAVLLARQAGFQTAFMAPTEVLAMQQLHKLETLLSPGGVRVGLLVGGMKRATRDDIVERLSNGDIDAVVGTHALITESVSFANLGLVVIDEQHRFGVMQRAALRAKARGHTPHTLVMTATPIPRTLAQSVYADLDVSIIDEMPPGRTPVKTFIRHDDDKPKIFAFVREEVKEGRQAFVVCPAIEESERAIHSAEKEAKRLQAEEFAGLRVALLHGKMTSVQKDDVMRLFSRGFVQVLISTTVVEVGMDVPNATVMVVLDAQTFGLAQLHQLRGRVGRGAAKSYCILVSPGGDEDTRRLDALVRTSDGFEIAEEDMRLRGSGDLVGVRQHGGDDFKLAHLIRDFPVFLEAKKAALAVVAADPTLADPADAGLAAHLASLDRAGVIRVSS